MGANDDLLPTLVSESFTNVAHRAQATVTYPGSDTGSVSAITATITYDSGNQSYSLVTPTGSITFGPGDIDNAQSSAGAVVYVKTSGNRTDSLTLTKAGTSGPLTYKYVGGAFWERLTQTAENTFTGSIDSIVYGVETQPGNVPVSGKANYDIDLIGARTTTNSLEGLAGQGTASVDFSSGKILFIGDITLGSPFGANDTFFGSAAISSGGTFSGSLTIEDGEVLKGTLDGRFFGPGAAEIGAAFSATGPEGMVATGAILGRKGDADVAMTKFQSGRPDHAGTFNAMQAKLDFDFTGTPGFGTQTGLFSNIAAANGPIQIRYDADTESYLISDGTRLFQYDLNVGMRAIDGSDHADWRKMEMTYESTTYVQNWRLDYGLSSANPDYRYAWQVFGMPTANIVRSGTAGYRIEVFGSAADKAYRNPMFLWGRGDLFVNLATGKVAGYVPISYDELFTTNPAHAAGSWTYTATLASNSNAISGTVALDGIGTYTGTGTAQLFGPQAQEAGGVFSATETGGNALAGSFVGVRDDTITDPSVAETKILDLTSPTELPDAQTDWWGRGYGMPTSVTYNPSSGSYLVKFTLNQSDPTEFYSLTLDSANLDSAHSTASDARYAENLHWDAGDIDLAISASLTKLGNGNPEIKLSYTQLASILVDHGYSGGPEIDDTFVLALGMPTRYVPQTGSATYSAITRGYATVQGGSNYEMYTLAGQADFAVNFGDGTVSATIGNMAGTRIYAFDTGLGPSMSSFTGFSQDMAISSDGHFATNGNSFQSIYGQFYGPNAAEIGGWFHDLNTGPGNGININGGFVGKKD